MARSAFETSLGGFEERFGFPRDTSKNPIVASAKDTASVRRSAFLVTITSRRTGFLDYSNVGLLNPPQTDIPNPWLRACGRSLFPLLRRQFPDEGPRNFGHLAVVVMDEEAGLAPVFDFQMAETGLGGNLVRAANRRMRFQNAQAILELDIKGVLPTEVAHVLDLRELPFAERRFDVLW